MELGDILKLFGIIITPIYLLIIWLLGLVFKLFNHLGGIQGDLKRIKRKMKITDKDLEKDK